MAEQWAAVEVYEDGWWQPLGRWDGPTAVADAQAWPPARTGDDLAPVRIVRCVVVAQDDIPIGQRGRW